MFSFLRVWILLGGNSLLLGIAPDSQELPLPTPTTTKPEKLFPRHCRQCCDKNLKIS
jgi:hypothetical protein